MFRFSAAALSGYRTRTLLMLLAMAIGVASVMLLTTLGEGARLYVKDKFTSLGTHLLIVLPGRSETTGGAPPLLGATPRDLTLEDALALKRSSAIAKVAPLSVGSAPVARAGRDREVTILGASADFYPIRRLRMGQGKFLPPGDPTRGDALCVLGHEIKQELFGNRNALGQWVRISDRRFRVIGVLSDMGQSLGVDLDDIAIIPVASAQAMFNTQSLFRVLVQATSRDAIPRAKQAITDIIRSRHDNEDDVTVITQDALLITFDKIFNALTLTLAGIATISLLVAGILIMNVMLIAVSQRTEEIGLLKALGAPQRQILRLFITESAMLSLLGSLLGLLVAVAGAWLLARLFPGFPLRIPLWSVAAALSIALTTGLLFGVLPARRAAGLDPALALSGR